MLSLNPILLGDFEPNALAVHLTKKPLSFADLLESAEKSAHLQNLYSHNLRLPTQVIRAATRYAGASWLESSVADKTETCLNVAISQAKSTIQSLQSDVLLAGVLGCPQTNQQVSSKSVVEEIELCLLLMVDLGVDCIFFEGFQNFALLKAAIEIACRLSDLPLAPFLEITPQNLADSQNFVDFADALGLEMVGWQGKWEFLQQHCTTEKSVFAWSLENLPELNPTTKVIQQINHQGVGCVLGAPGLSFVQWRQFVANLAVAKQN